jgi:hypothetical protein
MADTSQNPVAGQALERDEVATEGAETAAPAPADGASAEATTTPAVNGDAEAPSASNDGK